MKRWALKSFKVFNTALIRPNNHNPGPNDAIRRDSTGTSKYSDNMMQDLRGIANRALSNLDKTKPVGRDRSNSWGLCDKSYYSMIEKGFWERVTNFSYHMTAIE